MKLPLSILLLSCLTAFAPPSPQTASVKLAWDYDFVSTPQVTKFQIYYGIGAVVSNWNGTNIICNCDTNIFLVTGQVTNCVVTNLIRGQRYYFSATALTFDDVESNPSNQVWTNTPTKPGNPKTLIAQ